MKNNFFKFIRPSQAYFLENQKGVSLIISFFIMTIIIAVILAITILLYSEIKIIRNIGNSIVAFYSADSGVEKVLYYDRKVIPDGADRGLCAMFSYNLINNPQACATSESNPNLDSGLYCNNPDLQLTDPENTTGCDEDVCNACEISFETTFPDNQKKYQIEAKVIQDAGGYSTLTIESLGIFRGVKRKIELQTEGTESSSVIEIKNIYAVWYYYESGIKISVAVEVEAVNGISLIEAHIKNSPEGEDVIGSPIYLTLSSGSIFDGIFAGEWLGDEETYYIDIDIVDTQGNRLEQNNIEPIFL